MSQLTPFVRAFRALAVAAHKEADDRNGEAAKFIAEGSKGSLAASDAPLAAALVMGSLWSALNAAATDLEQQIAKDLARPGPRATGPAHEMAQP